MRPKNSKAINDFAARLNQVLDELGFAALDRGRAPECARKWGVTTNAAKKWLEGGTWPTPEHLARITKDLGVSLDWLVRGAGQRRPGTATLDRRLASMILAALDETDYPSDTRTYIFGQLYDYYLTSEAPPTPLGLSTLIPVLAAQAPPTRK